MGQLPPQEADIHLHVVVLGVGVIAPHLQQQLLLGHHPALAAQQQLQHVVFPAAQPQGPLPAGQLKGPRLQPQIPEGDGVVSPGVAAAPPQSLFSWGELGTLAGATAATLLIVQFAKLPLDRVWKIPTRLLVLVVAFLILLFAQIFTAGLSPESLPLIVLNSFLVAAAAMGAYEVAQRS